MAQITVNEAIAWMKTLKARHTELVSLRDDNSAKTKRYFGAHADKEVEKTPTYDVKVLDQLVTRLAREMRRLDSAIKKSNVNTILQDYDQDEQVLGEL